MTNTTNTAARTIDTRQTWEAIVSARFELGIRELRSSVTSLEFKIGMAHATAWVELWVDHVTDLYAFRIVKIRAGKGTVLAELDGIYAEDLARTLVAAWCEVCTARGW